MQRIFLFIGTLLVMLPFYYLMAVNNTRPHEGTDRPT